MKQNGCGSEVFKNIPRLCCVTIARGNANVQPATPEADFDSQASHLFYILNENGLSWRYLTILSSSSSSSSSQMDHSIHVHISAKALQLCSRLRDATFVALRLFEDQLVQCRIPHGGSLRAEGREAEAQAATIVTTQWNVLEWYLGIYALRMPIYLYIYTL